MERPQVSHDDLTDVVEMTTKIEGYINGLVKDVEPNIAVSSIIGSCINSLLLQCESVEQAVFFRTILLQLLDVSIRNLLIEKPENPSSF